MLLRVKLYFKTFPFKIHLDTWTESMPCTQLLCARWSVQGGLSICLVNGPQLPFASSSCLHVSHCRYLSQMIEVDIQKSIISSKAHHGVHFTSLYAHQEAGSLRAGTLKSSVAIICLYIQNMCLYIHVCLHVHLHIYCNTFETVLTGLDSSVSFLFFCGFQSKDAADGIFGHAGCAPGSFGSSPGCPRRPAGQCFSEFLL